MNSLWLLPSLSLLVLQAVRASPLTSLPSPAVSLPSTVAGAPQISAAQCLHWTADVSGNSTPHNRHSIDDSTKSTNICGPVTMFKTIKLIPQPERSNPSVATSTFLGPAKTAMVDVLPSAITQQPTLPTISLPAKPRNSFEPRISLTPQAPDSQPVDQSVEHPKLQPIIVGGITYAPIYAHHTRSNAIPCHNFSGAVEWHESYSKQESEPNRLGHETLYSGQGQVGLPPVVVGGLTYTLIGKKVQSAWQTPAPVNVGGSVLATNFLDSASLGTSSLASIQLQSPSWPPASSIIVLVSQNLTPLPTSSRFVLGSSTLLPGSPATTVNETTYSLDTSANLTMGNSTFILATSSAGASEGLSGSLYITNETFVPFGSTTVPIDGALSGQSVVPASPPTFIIAGETFTAYPNGLAIDGTEVFQGSTAIMLSGMTISLGSSDIVMGTNTILFASVTGLGAALSSGLPTVVSASGGGFRPIPTSTSAQYTHQPAAGQLRTETNQSMMMWFSIIALTIAVI